MSHNILEHLQEPPFLAKTHGSLQTVPLNPCSELPSGKRLHNYGTSPCLIGKSTISMAIFHGKL